MSEGQSSDGKSRSRAHVAWGPFVFTILLNLMVGWVLYHAFETKIPEDNQRVVDIILGNIMAAWFAANAYWFGTTLGSSTKTAIIAQAEPVKEPKE